MHIAYVCSHYPAPSHSFVQREVHTLRNLGVPVTTCSIWKAPPEQVLSRADQHDFDETIAVLPCHPATMIRAQFRAAFRRPRAYVRTLFAAMRLSPPGLRPRLWRLFYFAEAVMLWERLLPHDDLHLHAQFADGASDVALLAACLGGPRWSFGLAVHGPVEFYDISQNRLADKVKQARLVVAISDFGRSQVLTLIDEEEWHKVHVVRCGLDPDVFEPITRSDGDGHRILCVGRLVHLKGQSLLVEALARLRSDGHDVELVLVGDGPKRAALEQEAARLGLGDAVHFAGAVGQDEILDHYRAATLFCLPSFAEGLPVVLMEAMAVGLPVVTTRIMGVPELVEDGVSGRLVAPGRLDELVAALQELVEAPQERRLEMGRAGRARVLEEFDVRRAGARLAALFGAFGDDQSDGVPVANEDGTRSPERQLGFPRSS